jgi:hypothetical protein
MNPPRWKSIVESLSIELLQSQFAISEEAPILVRDAGVDALGVTANDIKSAYSGALSDKWREIAFMSDELLAQYCAIGKLTDEDFVRAVLVSFLVMVYSSRFLGIVM